MTCRTKSKAVGLSCCPIVRTVEHILGPTCLFHLEVRSRMDRFYYAQVPRREGPTRYRPIVAARSRIALASETVFLMISAAGRISRINPVVWPVNGT